MKENLKVFSFIHIWIFLFNLFHFCITIFFFYYRAYKNSFYEQGVQSMLPTLAHKSDEIFEFLIGCSHELMLKLKKSQRKIMVKIFK